MNQKPIDINIENLPELFKKRNLDSNKGDHGTVGIIGGSNGMIGSVLLAGRAALKIGAGKVLIGFASKNSPISVDFIQPELMINTAIYWLKSQIRVNTWVVGCGLGQSVFSQKLINEMFILKKGSIIVIDADALNILSSKNFLSSNYKNNTLILTPHPAEAARLLNCSTQDIQENRLEAVKLLSKNFKAWIVLKGKNTLICSPNDYVIFSNKTGNPGLASSGTGDVLAGMIGSLISQKICLEQALLGAVWLHGKASDKLSMENIGPIGLTASEIADSARKIRNNITYN
ncbi:carbohydrate kinase [Candidatus Kinetoplastibacterium blastocrithidii TCC012E]|uniref:ADP-dependent (S)-NAD(P)H-hydrate dehydratase n=1 Tax=Candidatus Kinetoplastidibacterium blastocrithidiae TCC012E TaxID=1208922 RepID=M1MCI7_9PROT|nr:NAD(P)H-hydrate dehydratase [Candidatus Kinetoplastibacterium blastocrithidii]AFZ83414.1 carbohydrate kinase [Candidatus Kinetoplastibacterium blastocrithidii (ex Strigomonas culicis)]AGF49510.1 carbohydrate kinase [Candidatus Kinetoplastibacterium blastocrithidii TCC012E]